MEAIDTLTQEHEVIEKSLALLETVAHRIRAGSAMPEGFGTWIVRFIQEFADGSHHHKEEQGLFPLMEKRGVPKEGGPIGCMLHEHELGRELTHIMETAASNGDAARFADAAEEYVVLLREHIFKENFVLFRIAERCLAKGDDEELMEQFRAQQGGDLSRYLAEIAAWKAGLVDENGSAGRAASSASFNPLPVVT